MPLEIGGLNFDPPTIGYLIGAAGCGSAIFQAIYFAKIVRYLGERRLFILAISGLVPIFTIIPLASIVAKHWGSRSVGVWILLVSLVALLALLDMAYGETRVAHRLGLAH